MSCDECVKYAIIATAAQITEMESVVLLIYVKESADMPGMGKEIRIIDASMPPLYSCTPVASPNNGLFSPEVT